MVNSIAPVRPPLLPPANSQFFRHKDDVVWLLVLKRENR